MNLNRPILLICLILLSPFLCRAEGSVVSVGVAHFPPYSIVEDEFIFGVEVEIIDASLAIMGYKAKFMSYPYGRLPIAFRNKEVAATIVTLKSFEGLDVFYSGIVLPEYQTVAVHLKSKKLTINSIKDLEEKSILAHQRANLFYGPEFREIADQQKKNLTYQETARQESQVLMFFRERAEVIVLAHEIFIYFKSRAEYEEKNKPYVVSKIFGTKFGFHNAFWDKKVRDDFDIGLNLIKKNGTYDKILKKYLSEYKPTNSASN